MELSKKGYNAFALIYRSGAQTACEDLARAIGFIFDHAEELEVNTDCYSLWGGSAGGRMKAAGIDTEFYKYPGLGHGFGIGTGTLSLCVSLGACISGDHHAPRHEFGCKF